MKNERDYLLQLSGNPLKFERVDQHVFLGRKHAINEKGEPRYTENWAMFCGKECVIEFAGDTATLLGLCRMMNIASGGTGQYDEPSHVAFKKGNSEWLYDVITGDKWRKFAKAA